MASTPVPEPVEGITLISTATIYEGEVSSPLVAMGQSAKNVVAEYRQSMYREWLILTMAFGGVSFRATWRELTDVSRQEDRNRAIRKAMDREHLAKASIEARTIKLADLVNNARSVVEHGGGFARIFLGEMRALLKVLRGGDARLYSLAQSPAPIHG